MAEVGELPQSVQEFRAPQSEAALPTEKKRGVTHMVKKLARVMVHVATLGASAMLDKKK